MYLLDTNICIYIIKNKPEKVKERFSFIEIGDVGLSVITEAELRFGATKSGYPEKNHKALDRFLLPFEIIPFTSEVVTSYARIRSNLEKKGTPIGAMDLLIASHTLSLNAILVTNNVKEFSRIPDLKIENWAE